MAAHRSKTPQRSEQQQQHVQRRLFGEPGAIVDGGYCSPGLQPPMVSPMQRCGRHNAMLQPAVTAALLHHGSHSDAEDGSPQVVLKGVENRIKRSVIAHS